MSKTAKIRIFVSVNSDGYWDAAGNVHDTDENTIRNVEHDPVNGDKGYWLEVELPIPEEKEEKPRKPLKIPVKVFEG